MSTEQELAAVAEAIRGAEPNFSWDEICPFDSEEACGEYLMTISRAAIAAVNTVRAEQASAGDREAVACLVSDAYFCGVIFAEPTATEKAKESAKAKVSASESAVLARMQRPVIAVTEERMERAMKAYATESRRMVNAPELIGLRSGMSFGRVARASCMRAALEAALREGGEG